MRCILLTRLEIEAVEFEKENTYHKARPLVSIHERMIADYPRGIKGRHFEEVRGIGIGMVLTGPRQSGLKKALIAQSRSPAVLRQNPVVNGEHIAVVDPDWFFAFRSHASLC